MVNHGNRLTQEGAQLDANDFVHTDGKTNKREQLNADAAGAEETEQKNLFDAVLKDVQEG